MVVQECVRNVYLLQMASDSSEPSAHSGSPSQRHLAGTHCPLLQANSVVAHVFFAAEKQKGCAMLHLKHQREMKSFHVTLCHASVATYFFEVDFGVVVSVPVFGGDVRVKDATTCKLNSSHSTHSCSK